MKIRYIILSFSFILLFFAKAKSQDMTNYNLYVQNPILYNSAFTIDDAKISAYANAHMQWVNFDGAPRNNSFGVQANLVKNMGFGISAYRATQGLNTNSNISLGYAYRVLIQTDHYITMGLSLGAFMEGLDYTKVQYADMTDTWFLENGNKTTSFAARFGLAYYFKGLELQVALPQLYQRSELSTYTVGVLSYDWAINDTWGLKPSVMLRTVKTTKTQFDGNLTGSWKNMIWAQLGYRSNNSYLMGVGLNYKEYGLAYIYQMDNSYLSKVSSGTHEIQLAYRFGVKKKEIVEKIDPNANKVALIANLIDEKYQKPVSGNVKIFKNGTEVSKCKSNNKGECITYLDPDVYVVEISAKGYIPIKDTVNISKNALGSQYVYNLKPVKIEKGLVFKFASVNFETGSDKLLTSSYEILNLVSEIFTDYPKMQIEVGGHTDNIGNENSNVELSQKRAKAVADYLISKGVTANQLTNKGFGSSKPIGDNTTNEGRLQNRRVEFTVIEF